MLSRRNIRIKVMQMLYAKSRDPKLTFEKLIKNYRGSVSKSFELYLFCILQTTRVARYALNDAAKRSAKLLPTDEDKVFNAKLAENDLVVSLAENPSFEKICRLYQLDKRLDKDLIRSTYAEFAKTDSYKGYVKKDNVEKADHTQILLDLFKFCMNNERFADSIEDHYANWVDDQSLVIGTVKKTIKALPDGEEFYEKYRPSTQTAEEFGTEMIRKVYENDEEYLEVIEPNLKNWDADRVAALDMILLKMAICELMIFPTIPTKVTLNEFVEIAKVYSTDKSKDFINGILDRMMKKLEKDGKINKEGRGLND